MNDYLGFPVWVWVAILLGVIDIGLFYLIWVMDRKGIG